MLVTHATCLVLLGLVGLASAALEQDDAPPFTFGQRLGLVVSGLLLAIGGVMLIFELLVHSSICEYFTRRSGGTAAAGTGQSSYLLTRPDLADFLSLHSSTQYEASIRPRGHGRFSGRTSMRISSACSSPTLSRQ